MADELNPSAQGQQPDAGGTGNPSQDASGQPGAVAPESGIQKRFDELTAQRREAERQAEHYRLQNEQLLQTVLQRANQPAEPAEPPVEISPDERAKLDYLMAPMRKQVEDLNRRHASEISAIKFQTAIQGQPPQVQERARALFSAWQGDPSKGGWTPQDAVIYARGELGVPSGQAGPVRDERGRFNGGATQLHQHAIPSSGNQTPAAEPDWDTTPPEKLQEFYAKRLGDKSF
jgi:hypothetical protein